MNINEIDLSNKNIMNCNRVNVKIMNNIKEIKNIKILNYNNEFYYDIIPYITSLFGIKCEKLINRSYYSKTNLIQIYQKVNNIGTNIETYNKVNNKTSTTNKYINSDLSKYKNINIEYLSNENIYNFIENNNYITCYTNTNNTNNNTNNTNNTNNEKNIKNIKNIEFKNVKEESYIKIIWKLDNNISLILCINKHISNGKFIGNLTLSLDKIQNQIINDNIKNKFVNYYKILNKLISKLDIIHNE